MHKEGRESLSRRVGRTRKVGGAGMRYDPMRCPNRHTHIYTLTQSVHLWKERPRRTEKREEELNKGKEQGEGGRAKYTGREMTRSNSQIPN